MRTTLELPDALVAEAMELTKIHNQTDVIKTALEHLIQSEKIIGLIDYAGKIDLRIDPEEIVSR